MKLMDFRHVIGYGLLIVLVSAGGASAAIPGTNTVDSGDIKNGQVKRADLARNAVTSTKVANRSLRGADLKYDTVTGAQVQETSLNMETAGCQIGLVHSFTDMVSIPQDSVWREANNGHNCSGGQIMVRHTGPGAYQVRFVGDPAALGLAQPVSGYNSVGVSKSGDTFYLSQRNSSGDLVNNSISFVTY